MNHRRITAALLAGCEALPAASSGPELPVGVAEITAAINARDTSSLATMLCPATRDRLDPLFGLTPAGDNIALRLVNSAVLSQLVIISAVVEDRLRHHGPHPGVDARTQKADKAALQGGQEGTGRLLG